MTATIHPERRNLCSVFLASAGELEGHLHRRDQDSRGSRTASLLWGLKHSFLLRRNTKYFPHPSFMTFYRQDRPQ